MKNALSVAAVALSLALVGCGGTEASVSEPQDTASVAEQQPSAPEATADTGSTVEEPAPETSAPEMELAEYGDTFTYDDGLEVKITYAGTYMASEYSAGAEQTNGQVALFDITVTNGTGGMIDPTMYMADVSYGETQKVAEEVYDSGEGLEGLMSSFPVNLLPGKSTTATGGWAMPHGEDHEVLFSYAPDFEHEPALYYGTITTK